MIPVSAQDANEANNTFTTATTLTPGIPISGSIHVNGDLDYFVFDIDQPGTIDITISAVAGIELETFLYNEVQQQIDNQRRSNTVALISHFSVGTGRYYLLVKEDDNVRSSAEEYTLNITLDTSDIHEPNNQFLDAAAVDFGESIQATIRSTGDLDYYSLNLSQAAVLEVEITAIPGVELETFLFDAAQLELNNQRRNLGLALSFNKLLAPGQYFLLVKDDDNSRSSESPYSMTVTLDITDTSEVNNSFANATSISIGDELSATIRSVGDLDYYMFEANSHGALSVDLSPVAGVELETVLYNENQQSINEQRRSIGAALNFTHSVAPGIYYLLIKDDDNSRSSNLPYTLSLSINTGDTFEPNNTFTNATSLKLGTPINGTILAAGDLDYFVVETPQPGVIQINISAVAGLELIGTLFNANQQELGKRQSPVGQSVIFAQLADAGVHYIQVRNDLFPAASSAEFYTLTVSLDTNDPNELNNTFENATLIGPDEKTHGTIWTTGDIDYYQFETTGPGLIDIQILNPPPFFYEVTVYDPAQQQIRNLRPGSGVALSTETNINVAGTHYVKINDINNNESSNRVYELTISGAIIDESTTILAGDVGRNGVVDAGDASLALRSIVGLAALSNNQRTAADVDGNQTVQAADASLILQYVVGLIDIFPVETPGKNSISATEGLLAWGDVRPDPSGEKLIVPLRIIGDSTGIFSAQATIHFDPDLLQFDDIVSDLPANWLAVKNIDVDKGVFHLAMAGSTTAPSSQLATLTIHAKPNTEHLVIRGRGFMNTGAESPLDDLDLNVLPTVFALEQNYPNPFNPVTTIRYDLTETNDVSLRVFNLLGQEIVMLINQEQKAGQYSISFDGSNLSSGTYIYRLQAGNAVRTRVMTLLK